MKITVNFRSQSHDIFFPPFDSFKRDELTSIYIILDHRANPSQQCQCNGCLEKEIIIANSDPYKNVKSLLLKLSIVLGWTLLIFLTYKVSQFEYEVSNFDPFEILGISAGSSKSEIKKAYHKKSIVLHPDKETGDEQAFVLLTKAYKALTDDEARKNWEKHGNP